MNQYYIKPCIFLWHSNTDKIVNASNIWANFFYVFNHATILSNGMPIYGQTVLYIWSKLSMLNVCAKCFQRYGQTFLCAKYSQINIICGNMTLYENIVFNLVNTLSSCTIYMVKPCSTLSSANAYYEHFDHIYYIQ